MTAAIISFSLFIILFHSSFYQSVIRPRSDV
nr:MAG TPA: hypothetical protein [Caudoviricetes sp.]